MTKSLTPRGIRTDVILSNNLVIPVYAGIRVANALSEVTKDMTLYKGVKLSQLLGAVYEQGKKDGARTVFERFDLIKNEIPYKNPGQPKKKKKVQKRKK